MSTPNKLNKSYRTRMGTALRRTTALQFKPPPSLGPSVPSTTPPKLETSPPSPIAESPAPGDRVSQPCTTPLPSSIMDTPNTTDKSKQSRMGTLRRTSSLLQVVPSPSSISSVPSAAALTLALPKLDDSLPSPNAESSTQGSETSQTTITPPPLSAVSTPAKSNKEYRSRMGRLRRSSSFLQAEPSPSLGPSVPSTTSPDLVPPKLGVASPSPNTVPPIRGNEVSQPTITPLSAMNTPNTADESNRRRVRTVVRRASSILQVAPPAHSSPSVPSTPPPILVPPKLDVSAPSPIAESPVQASEVPQPAVTPSHFKWAPEDVKPQPLAPPAPEDLNVPLPLPAGFSDYLSGLHPTSDPSQLLIAHLTSVFQNKSLYKKFLQCEKSEAQKCLDSFQQLLDLPDLDPHFRNELSVAIQRLSGKSGLYPACYELKDVNQLGEYPVNAGGFADIYKAMFQGKLVCLKAIRLYQNVQIEHVLKTTSKEAILWRQLSHPNILTFFGLYRFQNKIAIVTEWMENGNINTYLEQNPTAHRPGLASGVSRGISYLHKNDVVHGDLKGPNILVDNTGRPRVADFGISSISDSKVIAWTSQSSSSSKGGTVRWQAPELFAVGNDDDDEMEEEVVKNTFASDVYALGCVFVEIFTGDVPFASVKRDQTVMLRVKSGARPPRPPKLSQSWVQWGLTEEIWSCMEDCWKLVPSERPSAAMVVQRLTTNLSDGARQDSDMLLTIEQDSDMSLPTEFRQRMSKASEMGENAIADLNRILGALSL